MLFPSQLHLVIYGWNYCILHGRQYLGNIRTTRSELSTTLLNFDTLDQRIWLELSSFSGCGYSGQKNVSEHRNKFGNNHSNFLSIFPLNPHQATTVNQTRGIQHHWLCNSRTVKLGLSRLHLFLLPRDKRGLKKDRRSSCTLGREWEGSGTVSCGR